MIPGYAYIGRSLRTLERNLEQEMMTETDCNSFEYIGTAAMDDHLYGVFRKSQRSYAMQLLFHCELDESKSNPKNS